MSVITFSNNATVHWDLSDQATMSRAELINHISNIRQDGGFTNIVEALIFAKTKVFDVKGNR